MKTNNILGLYVAFYLAKFNKLAYSNLGFGYQSQTHKTIGNILDIKPATVKNWRDEFDSLFEHRAGWYQRKLSPSRISVVEAVNNLDEYSLRSIVLDILVKERYTNITEDLNPLVSIIPEETKKQSKRVYVPRNITGRKAEEIFMEWFNGNQRVFPKQRGLIDMRDYGCGYDFQVIVSEKQVYAIEVKGFSEKEGGIMITGKEWETACSMKTDYYLVFVSNINEKPSINIINNPGEKLSPKRNLQTIIQVNWNVSPSEIRQFLEEI